MSATIEKAMSLPCFALAVMLFSLQSSAQVAAPSLTASPSSPKGLDDVALTGSAYSGPAGSSISSATFTLAADAAFENVYLTFSNHSDALAAGRSMTEYVVDNDRLPLGIPLYARAQYAGSDGSVSDFSNAVMIELGAPVGLNRIYFNDFESVPVDGLPDGWEAFNTTTDTGPQGSYYNPEFIQWVVKDVPFLNELLYYPSYSNPSVVETELLIADNNTLVAESGDYVDAQNFYETHVITHEFDFTGVSDIIVAFNSNYIQNQDNIAILEYTLDNGTVNVADGSGITGLPVGSWHPIMYYLDSGSDVIYGDDGQLDVDATLSGTDDQGFFWSEYMFADDTVGPEEAAKYILPRLDDGLPGPGGVNGEYDSKRWERFRVPGLDNQPSVKFRFAYTGSWSWFWTIDNLQIWGNDGLPAPVEDWSIHK